MLSTFAFFSKMLFRHLDVNCKLNIRGCFVFCSVFRSNLTSLQFRMLSNLVKIFQTRITETSSIFYPKFLSSLRVSWIMAKVALCYLKNVESHVRPQHGWKETSCGCFAKCQTASAIKAGIDHWLVIGVYEETWTRKTFCLPILICILSEHTRN